MTTGITSLGAAITALTVLACVSETRAVDELDHVQKALTIISDHADKVCKEIPLKGGNTSTELSGSAKAELKGIIKKVADLGFEGAGKYTDSSYEGILQSDLVSALKDNKNCRLQISKDLQDKLITKAAPPGLSTTDKFRNIRTGATKEYIESILGPPQGTGEPPTDESGVVLVEHVARYLTSDFALEIYYAGNIVTSYSVLSLSDSFRPSLPDGKVLGADAFAKIGGDAASFQQSASEIYYAEELHLPNPIYRDLLVYVSWHGFPYRQNGQELDIPFGGATAAVEATQGIASAISNDDSATFQAWRRTAHANGYVVTRSGPHAPIIADDFFNDFVEL